MIGKALIKKSRSQHPLFLPQLTGTTWHGKVLAC